MALVEPWGCAEYENRQGPNSRLIITHSTSKSEAKESRCSRRNLHAVSARLGYEIRCQDSLSLAKRPLLLHAVRITIIMTITSWSGRPCRRILPPHNNPNPSTTPRRLRAIQKVKSF